MACCVYPTNLIYATVVIQFRTQSEKGCAMWAKHGLATVVILASMGCDQLLEHKQEEVPQKVATSQRVQANHPTFNSLTSAEHLQQAKDLCGAAFGSLCQGNDRDAALRHLDAIPVNAVEHTEAGEFAKLLNKTYPQIPDGRPSGETFVASSTPGKAATETNHNTYFSTPSDDPTECWWPTKMRVETDMNFSWLPDEERTCIVYSDETGKVLSVSCTTNDKTRSIPVGFCGAVIKGASAWTCRRTGERFVCGRT